MRPRVIVDFMTADPVRIPSDTPIPGAHALMRKANVRHLVVMNGGQLAGVVSQRDLYVIETLAGAEPETAVVEEAMSPDPYVVAPSTPLEQVAKTMWQRRCGSAVVVDGQEVLGIFTSSDALRALSELLTNDTIDAQEQDTSIQ